MPWWGIIITVFVVSLVFAVLCGRFLKDTGPPPEMNASNLEFEEKMKGKEPLLMDSTEYILATPLHKYAEALEEELCRMIVIVTLTSEPNSSIQIEIDRADKLLDLIEQERQNEL